MTSAKRTGKAFEKRVCETLDKWQVDVEPVPFSGAGKALKGDIHAIMGERNVFIECKKTRAQYAITIHRADLEKAATQARPDQLPVVVFGYRMSKLYAIIALEDLNNMLTNPKST